MPGPRHVLTILAVSDLPRARRFYIDAFGWEIREDLPVYVQFALPGQTAIAVYKREGFAINTGTDPDLPSAGGTTATELYLYSSDLETAIERIENAGARLLAPRAKKDWGDEVAYYADPDGNVIAIARSAEHETAG